MTTQISAENLSPITHNQIAVITTELLAQLYGTDAIRIQQNHKRNEERFIAGKHFFKLKGAELKEFKNRLSLSESVGKRARSLILWTERGAARHAKMLETDQAWDVFEKLEDCYFNQRKKAPIPAAQPTTQRHATITYFENGLPVASMPLMPGEIVMNPESCLEIVKRAGFVVVPCDEAGRLTLEELQEIISEAKNVRDNFRKHSVRAHMPSPVSVNLL